LVAKSAPDAEIDRSAPNRRKKRPPPRQFSRFRIAPILSTKIAKGPGRRWMTRAVDAKRGNQSHSTTINPKSCHFEPKAPEGCAPGRRTVLMSKDGNIIAEQG